MAELSANSLNKPKVMWNILFGAGLGFALAKAIEHEKKETTKPKRELSKKENIASVLDYQRYDETLGDEEYWKEEGINDPEFHKLRHSYLNAHKDLVNEFNSLSGETRHIMNLLLIKRVGITQWMATPIGRNITMKGLIAISQ